MAIERTMGPIPERQVDPLIARDSELIWSRIGDKPATYPPNPHNHSTLTSVSIFQNSNNITTNAIKNQLHSVNHLQILSDKNANTPAYFTLHQPNIQACHFGLDVDGYITAGGWSFNNREAPFRTAHIIISGVNSNDASLRIRNNQKVNVSSTSTEKNLWVLFNSKSGDAGYPAIGGLHFFGYNLDSTQIINPFSVLDDGTIAVNTKIRFIDGSELNNAKIDSWILPSLPTTSPNFGHYANTSTHQIHYYRKNHITNTIDFIGNLQNIKTLDTTTNYLAYTLPVGYRPSRNRQFPITVNNSIRGTATINQLGEVYLQCASNFTVSVSWSLEFSMPL